MASDPKTCEIVPLPSHSSLESADENPENVPGYRTGINYTPKEIDAIKMAYSSSIKQQSRAGKNFMNWGKFQKTLKQLLPFNKRPLSAIKDKIYRLGLQRDDEPTFLSPKVKLIG